MKIHKYIAFFILTVFMSVKTIYGQTSETIINEFLQWKLNPIENKSVQEQLPTERISLNVTPLRILNSQTIKLYKLDSLLSMGDIDTMNQQIKYWNNTKVWNTKTYKFSFINPDTLSNSETQFLELSIPIFSKDKQVCLFQSNIDCHQNYCHDEMLAIYKKQSTMEWKIIKVLHHTTF